MVNNMFSREEKEVFDVIFLSDDDFISKNEFSSEIKNRPYIVLKIHQNGDGEVLPLTSRMNINNDEYPKIKLDSKITTYKESYFSLTDGTKHIDSNYLLYADKKENFHLLKSDKELIKYHFSHFFK